MLPEGVSISIPEKEWDELFLPAIQDIKEVHLFLKDITEKYLLERSEVSCPAGGRVIQAGIFPIQHQIDTNGVGTLGIRGLRLCSVIPDHAAVSGSYSALLSIKGYVPEVGFGGGVYLFLISVFSVPEPSQIPPLVCNAHAVKSRRNI